MAASSVRSRSRRRSCRRSRSLTVIIVIVIFIKFETGLPIIVVELLLLLLLLLDWRLTAPLGRFIIAVLVAFRAKRFGARSVSIGSFICVCICVCDVDFFGGADQAFEGIGSRSGCW